MDTPTHDLAWLLHPRTVGEFFAEYWERGPLLVQQRRADYYDGLMTYRDLEDVISSPDARYPTIRLAKGGWFHPPEAYTRNVQIGFLTFDGVPDVERISAEYAKGATITLPALHRTFPPLFRLCATLEGELDHSVHGNAYVTPGRAAGFPPHYDTHDVLVLQLAGRKRWRIDEPTLRLPHDSQVCNPHGFTPGPRLGELELQAGDLLYLPRGYTHSTTACEGYSAHVTIGINIYSWVDLLGELVPGSAEREELRRALPPGFASRAELRPAIREQLARLLPGLLSDTQADQLLDQLIRRILPGRPRTPERFRADAIVIAADSLLRTPEERRYSLADHPQGVTLLLDGRPYVFPSGARSLLEAMRARETFRLGEFPQAQRIEELLGFARYLQGIGFLRSAG
jgi:hypothetical protein